MARLSRAGARFDAEVVALRLDPHRLVERELVDVVREHGTAARGVAHARPALEWLRDELGGAAYLGGFQDGEVVVTNTIPLSDEATRCAKVRQLSVAPLIAETIQRIAKGESVMSLFSDQENLF